jgi:hypothetical protein
MPHFSRIITTSFLLIILAFVLPTSAYAQTATSTDASSSDVNFDLGSTTQNGLSPADIQKLLQSQSADAQSLTDLPSQYKEIPLTVDMTPEVPGPNQTVTISIESYSTDLNRAQISWYVNGKLVKKGYGEKTIMFTTGNIGKKSTVLINIFDSIGNTTQKTISVTPESVDMLWQADTYTPPFNQGKALFSHQSKITIVAMPNIISNGRRISAKNLIYRWQENGNVLGDQSGYGKNTVTLEETTPTLNDSVQVDVSSLDGTISAQGVLNIESTTPLVLFYRNDPLTGISYEKALSSSFTLTEQEENIAAIPYFFSARNKKTLRYNWMLNNSPVSSTNSSIVLRNANNQEGVANLSVQVTQPSKVFQTVSDSGQVQFNKQ